MQACRFAQLGTSSSIVTVHSCGEQLTCCCWINAIVLHEGCVQVNVYSLCILLCPLAGRLDGSLFVFLPVLRDVVCERIVRIGSSEQRLNRKQHRSDLQGWTPLVYVHSKQDDDPVYP